MSSHPATPLHSTTTKNQCYRGLQKWLAFFNGLLSCDELNLFPRMDACCLGSHQTKYLTSKHRRPRPTQYEESTPSLLIRKAKRRYCSENLSIRSGTTQYNIMGPRSSTEIEEAANSIRLIPLPPSQEKLVLSHPEFTLQHF